MSRVRERRGRWVERLSGKWTARLTNESEVVPDRLARGLRQNNDMIEVLILCLLFSFIYSYLQRNCNMVRPPGGGYSGKAHGVAKGHTGQACRA
jgi:hypothetical protein